MWRVAIVALSLANLCLLRIWGRVANYSGADAFHMKCAAGSSVIVAALLNMLLLWGSGWALLALARTHRRWLGRAAKAGLLVLVLMALNSIRAVVSGWFPRLRGAVLTSLSPQIQLAAVIGVVMVLAAVLFVAAPRVRRWGGVGLLILSPLAPMMLIGAVARLVQPARYALPSPQLRDLRETRKAQTRVVWVILDEWDFRTAFETREARVRTPNLDRLATQSLFATRAEAPADETVLSIPSLLQAERFTKVVRAGPGGLVLTRARDSAQIPWRARDTILGRALADGINTAASGWYLPYCRLLAPALTACRWCEMARAAEFCEDSRAPVLPTMAFQARSLFETARFSPFGASQGFEGFVHAYRELADAGVAMAANEGFGFVFLHLPIPHNAGLRMQPDGRLVPGSLADALELVDRTIGRLVDAMHSTGVWPATHLVLSSDHPLRGAGHTDPRIPFLLRLAGSRTGCTHSHRFNTVVTGELLLRLLAGEITTCEAAAGWLERHGEEGEAK